MAIPFPPIQPITSNVLLEYAHATLEAASIGVAVLALIVLIVIVNRLRSIVDYSSVTASSSKFDNIEDRFELESDVASHHWWDDYDDFVSSYVSPFENYSDFDERAYYFGFSDDEGWSI